MTSPSEDELDTQPSAAPQRLGADAPIQSVVEDLLGFGPFTRALGEGLVTRAPEAGFVAGLQARWGMGKSSAVNLCLEHIRKIDSMRPDGEHIVIRAYNPWFFSGVDALTSGYLAVLTEAVEDALGARGISLAKRAWRRAGKAFRLAQDHSEAIGASAAGAATYFSAGKALVYADPIKNTIVSALKKKPSSEDLSRRFEKLMRKLDKGAGRALIVVDDLDRLQPADLRQVLSLIKTFGSLTGVTHLLVYDRDIVDAALADARLGQADRRLPSYREKIVQAEFDLPHATQTGLRGLVARGMDPLIATEADFDQSDWYHASHLAAGIYLRSPRDVVRFTNGLSVTWPSIAGEAYFPDLFVVELWRLFERDFYDGIRDNKAVMIDEPGLSMLEDERKAIINGIVARIPDSRRGPVMRVFSRLFPKAAQHLEGGRHWGHTNVEGRWRVGQTPGFDVFFRMSPPLDEYTQGDLKRIRTALGDNQALDGVFSEALARPAAGGGTFLPKLFGAIYQTSPDALDRPLVLLDVLARRGEEILAQGLLEPEMTWSQGREEIGELAGRCLSQASPDERASALGSALRGAGISTRAIILSGQFDPHDMNLDPAERNRIGESQLRAEEARALAEEFIVEIETEPSVIVTTPVGWKVLSLWESIRGPEPIRHWIEANLDNASLVIQLTDLVMTSVTSSKGQFRELRGKVIWRFIDLAVLRDAAADLLGRNLVPQEARELVVAFVRDAGRRLEEPQSLQDDD